MEERLLEPKDAEFGARFLKVYIDLQKAWRDPASLDPIAKKFTGVKAIDYSIVAKEVFKLKSYRILPKDTKSFIGRCAVTKKKHPSWTFEQIVNQELHHITMQAERLFSEVKSLAEDYYWKNVWPRCILPRLVSDWEMWAEKNPQLAYIDD